MFEFFSHLLDTSDFPARWHCGNWSPAHGWLHIASDCAIFLAYMAIPIVLVYLVRRRRDLPFPRVFALFVAFIAFCGASHLVEALIFWEPVYRLSGALKLGTATASWATVAALVPTVRQALTLRSAEELEREVAERTREVAREKATLEAILASLSPGVAVADAAGKVVEVNFAAEQLVGLRVAGASADASADGAPRVGFFRLDGSAVPDEQLPLERVLSGERSVDEDLILRRFSERRDRILSTSARRIDSEAFQGVVVVFTDVTDRERARARLARANDELAQFAYAAAHDLREPLRQITTYSQLLGEETAAKLNEEEHSYLGFMRDSALRMDALVRGLLSYSKAGDAAVEHTEVDTNEVFDGVVQDLSVAIRSAGAEVSRGDLPKIAINETLLAQVFQNLLSNAIKFAGPSPPQVSVSASSEPHQIRLRVSDNGIGIPEKHYERIFRVFQRLHSTRQYPGTGIGLSLCKRVIEQRGGQIKIESRVGEGTTFEFTIPNELPVWAAPECNQRNESPKCQKSTLWFESPLGQGDPA